MELAYALKEYFYFQFVNRHFSDFSTVLEVLIGVSVFLTFVDNFFEFIDKKFTTGFNSLKSQIDANYQNLIIYQNELNVMKSNDSEYFKIPNYETKFSELENSILSYIDKVDLINSQFKTDFENKLKNKFTGLGFTNLIFLFIFLFASSVECSERTFSNMFLFSLSLYWLLYFLLIVIPFSEISLVKKLKSSILKFVKLESFKGFNLMKNVIYVGLGLIISVIVVLYIKYNFTNYWFNNDLIFGFKNIIVLSIPCASIVVCGLKIRTIYKVVLDINFENREEVYQKIPELQVELNTIATTIEQTRSASNFEVE